MVRTDRTEPKINFKKQAGIESRKRSLAKTISWRIIATAVTILVAFIWLGEWTTSIALAITANGIKAVLYYTHERAWNRTSFGRKKVKEDYTI